MKWEDFDAFKLGIIDEKGKRQTEVKLDTPEKKDAYTPFIRMAVNLKRITGGNRLFGFASSLFLIREKYNLSDFAVNKIVSQCGIIKEDLLRENNEWFTENGRVIPGVYRLAQDKLMVESVEFAKAQDRIRIGATEPHAIFGVNIYEATHINSNQTIYVSADELIR